MSFLEDKVVVITGASDGIGKSIAIRLGTERAKIILIARNENKLRQVAENIQSRGGIAKYYPCDIRSSNDIEETVRKIISDFGRIDVLINNAGIWQKLSSLEAISEETIQDVIQTNLLGTIMMTKSVLPFLKEARYDTYLINIVSKSGVTAQEGQSIYTASKYGVKGFTDVLRIDLKNTKIHVGAIYQSGTNTDMFRKTGEDFPTEKFTNPDDLAEFVTYMLNCPAKIWIPELYVNYK